jgi:hypothetical protein
MRAQELVALAKAHGIDLSSIPGIDLGATGKRGKGRDELLAGVEVVPTAEGGGSPGARQPYRSSAACDLTEPPWWLAARYSFCSDRTAYWPLWWYLAYQAQRLARREDWPPRARGARGELRFYLLDLSQLVLDAQAARPLFVAAPVLFPAYMQVEPETWQQVLEPRYRSLSGCYERWLGIARGWIGRRLEQQPQPSRPEALAAIAAEPETIGEEELVAELSALLHEEPQALPAALLLQAETTAENAGRSTSWPPR